MPSIVRHMPPGVRIVPQGQYVADSLQDYLHRHPELESLITRQGTCRYLTTESEERFSECAQIFLHEKIRVEHITLG
jgi:glutamate racemase